jgi:hypothetical protein
MAIQGLEAARRILGDAVIGPEELAAALGGDPLANLSADERAAAARVPFDGAALEAARRDGELLVMRLPRHGERPLTMLGLAEILGGLDPRVHRGVGYSLRDEWTIDTQPFAASEACALGWRLVRREPLPETRNRLYRAQDAALAARSGDRAGKLRRRSAVEIAYDTLLWHRLRGERLLADAWDWSSTPSSDNGYVAVGGFGDDGLGVIAYSRAVRFGTLGVCAQR